MITTQDFQETDAKLSGHYASIREIDDGTHLIGAVKTPQGIVSVWVSTPDSYTRLDFTCNGRSYSRHWQKAWGKRTVVRMAKQFAEDKGNPLLNLVDGLSPCLICGKKPIYTTQMNNQYIIHCSNDHSFFSTGSWTSAEEAVSKWNNAHLHFNFIDDGSEHLPCPQCGASPYLDIHGKLSCNHTNYVYGANTPEGWNGGVRKAIVTIAKLLPSKQSLPKHIADFILDMHWRGHVTEGYAARLLGVDRLDLRAAMIAKHGEDYRDGQEDILSCTFGEAPKAFQPKGQ